MNAFKARAATPVRRLAVSSASGTADELTGAPDARNAPIAIFQLAWGVSNVSRAPPRRRGYHRPATEQTHEPPIRMMRDCRLDGGEPSLPPMGAE